MDSLWPWLVLAGLGALHGLNPATGWLLAAAWGVHSGGPAGARLLWALVPIALGHVASIALVVAALALGLTMERSRWQTLGLVLLATLWLVVGVFVWLGHLAGRRTQPVWIPAGFAGLALWSFVVATAHGAGLLLVPALAALCIGEASASASRSVVTGPWAQALAAVAVHTGAMLVVSGAVTLLACRAWGAGGQWLQRVRQHAAR